MFSLFLSHGCNLKIVIFLEKLENGVFSIIYNLADMIWCYYIFLFLTLLKMVISRSIHVAANGIISLFMAESYSTVCVYRSLYPFLCQ